MSYSPCGQRVHVGARQPSNFFDHRLARFDLVGKQRRDHGYVIYVRRNPRRALTCDAANRH